MQILRLKELLKQKEVTSKQLSECTGISKTSISQIITGKQLPRLELLVLISKILNVDIKELFVSTKKEKQTIHVILNNELQTFSTVEDFKAFANYL